jgi:CheY-like chemotaxis protein
MARWKPDVTLMNYNVLIVDDSKLARMVVTSALRRIRPDWTITEATSGDEALAAIKKGGVQIVLVDFNMPGMDGLVLVAKLRQADADMPIALVSANLQDEIIARARELNAAFVGKPLTDEALGAFLTGATLRLKKAIL